MNINNLPKTEIVTPKPSINVDPVANKAPAAPPSPKPVEKKVEPVKAEGAVKNETPKPSTAKDTTITDVKSTGEKTAEGEPTFTLKVNGKDVIATQSEILELAQRAKGADKAMKDKAELEKLANNLLTNFDNDAYGLLVQRHGKDKAKQIAIGMVKNLIAEEARDPKDVELEQLRRESKATKEAAAAKAKADKDAQDAATKKANQKTLYTQLLTSIDTELNNTHLPKDKLTLTRVLNFIAAGKKANGQAWTVKDAVQAVETEDMGHASYYAKQYVEGKLPSEKFKAIFGAEAFKKLNKEQIDTLKKADKVVKAEVVKNEAAVESPTKRNTLSKNKGSEGMTEREWRKLKGGMGGI
jgi:hypothetical protein